MSSAWSTKLSQVVRLGADDQAALDRLTSRPTRFGPGRTILRQGDPPDQVAVVLSGWVARYKILGDGQRQILALMVPGDTCDMHAYVLRAMDHSVAAIGEAEVALTPRQEIAELMRARPALASGLWWSTLQSEAITREWLVSLGRRNAYRRAAHLMQELHVRLAGAGVPGEQGYDFPLTQTDLSDALGLSVVHVNRVLQRLREDGLINLKRGRLFVPDPAALAAAAEFDPAYLHLDAGGGARDGAV